MENNKVPGNKKKLLPIIVAVIVLILLVVVVLLSNKKQGTTPDQNVTGDQTGTPAGEQTSPEQLTASGTSVNPALEGSVVQAPGADLISKTGQVINQEGKEVKTDVAYNSPEAPRQTLPVEIKEIPLATKLTLDANGFTPKEFKIGKGRALTVALTGSADASHVLAFESPLMSAVYINVRPGETRAVTFNAPDVAGSYTFFCDFPGHRGRGEVGTMIVE
jgi:plastocyanin